MSKEAKEFFEEVLPENTVKSPEPDTRPRPGDPGLPGVEIEFTSELAADFCARLAEGRMLSDVCRDKDMPSRSTIFRWLYQDKPGFRELYATAREFQTEAVADDIFEISDDGRNDWMERHYGDNVVWVENGEATRRSQLRVDSRKWWLSKIKPKKYCDKLDLTSKDEKLPTPIYMGRAK